MKTTEYLDQVRALTPTGTVYAAAQLLGIHEDTVRGWNNGERFPDAYGCARLAEVLNLPIEQVLADINAEAAKTPEKRAYWESLARKFAACVVMGSAITTAPSTGHSATGQANVNAETSQVTNYVTQLIRSLIDWLNRPGSTRVGETYRRASSLAAP